MERKRLVLLKVSTRDRVVLKGNSLPVERPILSDLYKASGFALRLLVVGTVVFLAVSTATVVFWPILQRTNDFVGYVGYDEVVRILYSGQVRTVFQFQCLLVTSITKTITVLTIFGKKPSLAEFMQTSITSRSLATGKESCENGIRSHAIGPMGPSEGPSRFETVQVEV